MESDLEQTSSQFDDKSITTRIRSTSCKQICWSITCAHSLISIIASEEESEHDLWQQLRLKEQEVAKLKQRLGILPRSVGVETEPEQPCELDPPSQRVNALESFGAINSAALQLYRAAEAR